MGAGLRQSLATLVVWAHACLGIYFWLRYRPWFARWSPLLLIASVLLPVLGLLGFVVAGRQLETADPPPSTVPPEAPRY